jgi:hypothetical protein
LRVIDDLAHEDTAAYDFLERVLKLADDEFDAQDEGG